jgi:hypothetical protein
LPDADLLAAEPSTFPPRRGRSPGGGDTTMTIGIPVYQGVDLLDVTGPYKMFK